MKKKDTKPNKVLLECMVSLKKNKYNVLLTLTEEHILLQKKGTITKKYKRIKDILIEDIKRIKDKAKIERMQNKVTIYTKENEFFFICENKTEAKKIVEEMNKLVLGEDALERTAKKSLRVLGKVKKTAKTVGGVALATAGTYKALKETTKILTEVVKKNK